MLDHVIYPWLDTLIVNLLVWNNSRLQPSNRPIKNNAISCFTFMIDTRIIGPILFLNIFGLFITPRLSTFNSGGNSGLILVGHCEMETRSIPKFRKILENLTNFHFGSILENCANFPRKNDLFICQSSRFPFQGEYPPPGMDHNVVKNILRRGSHFTKIARKFKVSIPRAKTLKHGSQCGQTHPLFDGENP